MGDENAASMLISPPPEESLRRTTPSSKRKRNPTPAKSTPNPKASKQRRPALLDSPTKRKSVTPIPPYEPPAVVHTPPREILVTPTISKSSKRKSAWVKRELPPDIDLSTPMPPPSPTDDPLLLSGPIRPQSSPTRIITYRSPLPPSSSPSAPQPPLPSFSSSPESLDLPHPLPIIDWANVHSEPDPSSDSMDFDNPTDNLLFNFDLPASDSDSDTTPDPIATPTVEGVGEYTGKWRMLRVPTKQDPPSSATRTRMEDWGRPISPFPKHLRTKAPVGDVFDSPEVPSIDVVLASDQDELPCTFDDELAKNCEQTPPPEVGQPEPERASPSHMEQLGPEHVPSSDVEQPGPEHIPSSDVEQPGPEQVPSSVVGQPELEQVLPLDVEQQEPEQASPLHEAQPEQILPLHETQLELERISLLHEEQPQPEPQPVENIRASIDRFFAASDDHHAEIPPEEDHERQVGGDLPSSSPPPPEHVDGPTSPTPFLQPARVVSPPPLSLLAPVHAYPPSFAPAISAPAIQHDNDDDEEDEDEVDVGFIKITSADPRAAARAAAILKQHDYDCFTRIEARARARRKSEVFGGGVRKAGWDKERAKARRATMGVMPGGRVFVPGSPVTTLPQLLKEAEMSLRTPIVPRVPPREEEIVERKGDGWCKEDWKMLDACFTDERLEVGKGVLAGVDEVRGEDVVQRYVVFVGGHDVLESRGDEWSEETLLHRVKALQNKQRAGNVAPPTTPYTPLAAARRVPAMSVPDFTPLGARARPPRRAPGLPPPVAQGPFAFIGADGEEEAAQGRRKGVPGSLLAPRYSHLMQEALKISAAEPGPSNTTEAEADEEDERDEMEVLAAVTPPPPPRTRPAPAPQPAKGGIGTRVKGYLFSYLPSRSKSKPVPKPAAGSAKPGLPLPPPAVREKPRGPINTPVRAPEPKPAHPKELVRLHPAPPLVPESRIPRRADPPRRLVELHPLPPDVMIGEKEDGKAVRRRSSAASVKELVKSFEEMEGAVGAKGKGVRAASKSSVRKQGWRP